MGQILSHPLLCTTIMSLTWRMKILTGYGRRKMSEILNMTFSKFYSPSQYLAVDAVIVLFKGKVIFWQYIPKKHELLASKFINHVKRFDRHMIWQFILSLTGVRKFHIEILNSSSWMIYWKRWHKSERHKWHTTKVGLSRSMTVTQPKCHVWNVSGGKRNVAEVWCVCNKICSWYYHAKAQLQKFWGWNFLCKHAARNRKVSKINWKL